MSTEPEPPRPAERPTEIVSPNGTRIDEYAWLRDDTRSSPEVLAHLRAENAYREAHTRRLQPLADRLYDEIVGRIQQDDDSVPYRLRRYRYWRRYRRGREYPVYLRCADVDGAQEEVLLELNELATGHDFYDVGEFEVSPDDRWLAYADDTVGRRQYTLRFKDLVSGRTMSESIANVEPAIVWTADSSAVLYIEKDPRTLLGLRVRCHVLGTDPASDVLVYEETDDSFYTDLGRSKDGRFLYVYSHSTETSEQRLADANFVPPVFSVLIPRERAHEYQADVGNGRWLVRTNWQAVNFRLVEAPLDGIADRATWRDVIPHREDALLQGFDVFRDHLAIEERSGGLRKVRVRSWDGALDRCIDSQQPAYRATLGDNEEYAVDFVRCVESSPAQPPTAFDVDVRTGERRVLKVEPVLGGFDPSRYRTEYLRAPARDGAQIPVALVYRRDVAIDGGAPLLQYGYGAYGISSDPVFLSSVISLLDRGFVYAIAQIRGGQELGRRWYDNGRLLAKRHSFTDFIDVTEFLVARRYADPRRVFARGGSAGGLLMGAVINLAPQLYRGIVAHVPFVDVVTTMLDDTLPLTTNEYDEWGNPNERRYYDYMLSYSPYDNVTAQSYPALYVTTGLWDSQVQYFEPAKWVARLRRLKSDPYPLLFKINMEAGHGGKSGRFEHYREVAEEYAFLVDQAGLNAVAATGADENARSGAG
jgi:oligopeptidase B